MTPTMSYFRSIHNAYGADSAREAKLAEYRAQFAADFDSSINVEHDVLRNGVKQSFIIVPTDTGCDLWARPGETFHIGDIVYFNTLHWLVTDINFGDSLNRSGKMVRCNRQICWQNPRTGEIITRWCLATKPYTSNIHEGMVVANSNREYKIQLGCDEETLQVGLNRRFLLEKIDGQPKAYEVVSVDTITNRYEDAGSGFLVWNLSQHEYNPATDNDELMIADYVEPDTQPVAPSDEALLCRIDGDAQIRCGTHRRYKALFFEQDGVSNTDVQAVWRVEAPTDTVTWSISDDGLTLTLDVPDGSADVGDAISITLCDANGIYVSTTLGVEVIPFL